MKNSEEIRVEQSQRIFWVIQTVFSLLLARSIFDNRDFILHPFSPYTLGLLLVYGTVLWSWVDYSYTTIVSPYRFDKGGWERPRFVVDLVIVISYAYLLFSLAEYQSNNEANISPLFVCLTAIFGLYAASGLLRVVQYGRRASRLGLICIFAMLYGALAAVYFSGIAVAGNKKWFNVQCIVIAICLMSLYRLIRSRMAYRKVRIGVDVDGVLANQIQHLLPIIRSHYSVDLTYDQITEWALPIANTDLATIIRAQQKDRRYVTRMPVIEGAQPAICKLVRKYRIEIVTARDPGTDTWTRQWLDSNRIPYDSYTNMKEGNKHNVDEELDLLIDDYLGNVEGFLQNSDGKAILFSQPWNKSRQSVEKFIQERRLVVANSWEDVIAQIPTMIGRQS